SSSISHRRSLPSRSDTACTTTSSRSSSARGGGGRSGGAGAAVFYPGPPSRTPSTRASSRRSPPGSPPAPSAERVTVLVLDPRVPADALPGLEARFGGEVAGDDVTALVITPRTPIGRRELERLPALQVVATASIGYDHVDVEAAAARDVWVC